MSLFCNVTDEATGEVSTAEFMGFDGDCAMLNIAKDAKSVKATQIKFDKPDIERAKLVYLEAVMKADRAFVVELNRVNKVGNESVRKELSRSAYLDHYEKRDKLIKAFGEVVENTK